MASPGSGNSIVLQCVSQFHSSLARSLLRAFATPCGRLALLLRLHRPTGYGFHLRWTLRKCRASALGVAPTRIASQGVTEQIGNSKRRHNHVSEQSYPHRLLGGDAEVRTGKNNQKFTTLSLATKTSYKDKESGEYISHTEWHRSIVFGKLGEFAATLKKGAHIQIEGEIRHTEYTPKKAKKPVRTDSIRVNSILKLDRAEKAAAEEQEANEELPFDEAAE